MLLIGPRQTTNDPNLLRLTVEMLQLGVERLRLTVGMLRLGAESQHISPERSWNPTDPQHPGLAGTPPGLRMLRIGLPGLGPGLG